MEEKQLIQSSPLQMLTFFVNFFKITLSKTSETFFIELMSLDFIKGFWGVSEKCEETSADVNKKSSFKMFNLPRRYVGFRSWSKIAKWPLRFQFKLIRICNAECLVRGGKKTIGFAQLYDFWYKKNQIVPESLGPNHSCSTVSFN